MNANRPLRKSAAAAALYGSAVVLALVLAALVMQLWRASLRVPFAYSADGLFTGAWIKGMHENGWYVHNDRLGYPFPLEMEDFPLCDSQHFLVLKVLALFTSNYALTYNLYFLLGFPLTALSSVFVLRRLQISAAVALFGGLLFTCLPYHFFRGAWHLFLAAYYLVPLIILVIVRIACGQDVLFRGDPSRPPGAGDRLRAVGCLLLCAAIGSAGIYHAFFSCFFLLVAGGYAWYQSHGRRGLVTALLLIVVISTSVFVNAVPTLVYRFINGPNESAVVRSPGHAEVFGLRVSQLLLPITGHRLPWLRDLKQRYNEAPGMVINENDNASLGLLGSLGFVVLAAQVFTRRRIALNAPLNDVLVILNASAVLLATVGGLGVLFSLLVCSWIRSYNRISVFIAFFCLLTVVLALETFRQRSVTSRRGRCFFHATLGLLMLGGILDQTSASFVLPYEAVRQEYKQDAAFVRAIERVVPEGAAIFQLPYVPFPENPPVHRLHDYELFRGYLHSQTLRWSYATVKGRAGDWWQSALAARPAGEMVRVLALVGFSGIYLDRAGYADRGRALEAQLTSILRVEPTISSNKRLAFFNLTAYGARLRSQYATAAWESERARLLQPVYVKWRQGFFAPEQSAHESWRWCTRQGTLELYNGSGRTRTVTLTMRCCSGWSRPARLSLRSDLFSRDVTIDERGTTLSQTLEVPPGRHLVSLYCDAAPAEAAATDPRELIFRVVDFSLSEQ